VRDSRAADDIRNELAAGCLEEFPSARLAIVPLATIKQNVTDKKLPAHEAAAGKQPKIRRISDKSAGASDLAACNAWVDMQKRAKLELCRLDDILVNVVAMCAMAVAWNKHEVHAGRPTIFGAYMNKGDVEKAYRNPFSCPLDSWKSGLYLTELIRGKPHLKWLLNLALDFSGTTSGANFCDVSSGATISWISLIRLSATAANIDTLAPAEAVGAMQDTRARGFIRSCRLRHSELRAFNSMEEQLVDAAAPDEPAAPDATEVNSTPPQAAKPDSTVHSLQHTRGVRAAAISHALDYDESREWFRVHT
jgi:hypothetical protein